MRLALILVAVFAVLTLAIPMAAGQAVHLSNLPAVSAPAESTPTQAAADSSDASGPEASSSTSASPQSVQSVVEEVEGKDSFKILNRSTGKVEKVKALDYIRGALASEMPATFHAEALAAQAVAAHTWALYSAELHSLYPDETLKGADFSADPDHDEGYISEERFFERFGATAELYWPKICKAADFAASHVLLYQGDFALTAYHSTSAGMTESAENVWMTSLPYLIPVESEGDSLAPNFRSTETYPAAQLKTLLLTSFPDASFEGLDPPDWLVPIERSVSGYVTLLSVGDQEVSGQQLRTALSLRSTCMTISYADGVFTIETEGYGHGVGMSQYGADFMARQGSDCAAILAHYYPGTTLASVA